MAGDAVEIEATWKIVREDTGSDAAGGEASA